MTALQQRVRRTIARHALCPPGARVLVALSGGSDSVALTLLLLGLARHGDFTVVSLAHLNHGLRPTSVRDEEFCRHFAARLGLRIAIDAADVQRYAATQRVSSEAGARIVRYDFLHRSARDVGADCIATGHTQDDQAETFLLKLIRGAGLTGLGGVYPRKGVLIRPLLDVSRADLRSFLVSQGEAWVEDETNADVANPRNRVRHLVLPELDRASGGATRPAIARAARLAREDGEWLDELGDRAFATLALATAGGVDFDAAALSAVPAPVRRRVLLKALRELAGEREVGLEHVDAALAALDGNCRAAELPGCRVELRRGKLVLVKQGAAPK